MADKLPALDTLKQCEQAIEQHQQSAIIFYTALRNIRDQRLYHPSNGGKWTKFADYTRERWGWSDRHVRRLIDTADVAKNLADDSAKGQSGPIGPPAELPESHARELKKAPKEKRAEVLEQAQAEAGDKPVTAASIRSVMDRLPVGGADNEDSHKASQVKGEDAQPKSDILSQAEQDWEPIRKAVKCLKELPNALGAAAKGMPWFRLSDYKQEMEVVRELANSIAYYRPQTGKVCPLCNGKGCKPCRKTGWMPKIVYEQVPKDKR